VGGVSYATNRRKTGYAASVPCNVGNAAMQLYLRNTNCHAKDLWPVTHL
jgi:hypothetical protein